MNRKARLLTCVLLSVAASQATARQATARFASAPLSPIAAPLSRSALLDLEPVQISPADSVQSCSVSVAHEPTLVVRDPQVLAEFQLPDVLDAIAARSGIPGTTGDDIWRRWWATQRARNRLDPSDEPRCSDNGDTINGYPIVCPRPERVFENLPSSSHRPVALFNRFDLARTDGSTCGEYRIAYAFDDPESGVSGRNLLILEAVLPNPNPGCGIAACKPVVEFWAGLENLDSAEQAQALSNFYFDGLDDFAPVIDPAHYGLGGGSGGGYGTSHTGQFRTNQFINNESWTLREFQLRKVCGAATTASISSISSVDASRTVRISPRLMSRDLLTAVIAPSIEPAPAPENCKLVVQPVSVKNNPFRDLWQAGHSLSIAYQDDFVVEQNLELLLPQPEPDDFSDIINKIKMFDDDRYNAGESVASGAGVNFYSPDAVFSAEIEMSPPVFGSGLSAQDLARRAETQSCAGCHSISNNQDLGDGDVWPSALDFVHVDESSQLSFALTGPGMFLDHRAGVMERYLNELTCETDCIGSPVISAPRVPALEAAPMMLDPNQVTIGGSVTH